jgi:hypothetical protein
MELNDQVKFWRPEVYLTQSKLSLYWLTELLIGSRAVVQVRCAFRLGAWIGGANTESLRYLKGRLALMLRRYITDCTFLLINADGC